KRTNLTQKWNSLASSANGKLIAVVSTEGYPIFSTNFGVNWFTPTNLARYWDSVVCSADGNNLAMQYSGDDAGPWVSTNYGVSWQPVAVPINQGGDLATTASGNLLMLVSRGLLTLSTNWGTTWFTPPTRNQIPGYTSLSPSADGSTILTFGGGDGQAEFPALLWVSTNSGASWASSSPTNIHWTAVASSADGKVLAAVSQFGGIWVSQTPPSPQLNVNDSSNTLDFSWIVQSTNMVLEESPDLKNWTPLTNAPSLNYTNLEEQLSLSPDSICDFFRLVSQ
ncbi:MAG: WD40/YVTN/BNR-like repeat-containing protein, partial [Limisphaerales bacterium]